MAWCNPIGNLRRVSLCTRRYHGTRPRCHGYTTNVRAHLSCERTPSNASNAPCPNTTTTMALFLRQVSRSCWKNREDDRLPSGIRAPLFFFFYRLLQLHNLLLLFCGFALETFQKTRVIFFSENWWFSLFRRYFFTLPILTTSSDHNVKRKFRLVRSLRIWRSRTIR